MTTTTGTAPATSEPATVQLQAADSVPVTQSAPAPVPAPVAASTPAVVAADTDVPVNNGTTTAPAGTTSTVPATAAKEHVADSVTTKSAPSSGPKASTSADEKQDVQKSSPASNSTTTPKASPKKRRKRGGLAGIFVALGCLSANEFDDDVMKAKPPTNHASKASASAPKPANGSNAAKLDASAGSSGTKDGLSGIDAHAKPPIVIRSSEPTVAPLEETAGLTSGAVQAPGSGSEILHQHQLHRNESDGHLHAHHDANRTTDSGYTDLSESEGDEAHQEMLYDDEYEDEEDRLIAQGGIGIPVDENGNPAPLLPALREPDLQRKCLVLDLDETLLHSSFKMLPSADYIVPVEIESQTHNVYVIKRPGVDHFLAEMGKIYEIVVFTASLSKYADPVLDMLDVGRVVRHRLFRESCYNHKGNYVKDLSQLGRDMSTCIIIDNSPASYIFHPNNAVPVSTWFNDPHDTELTDLCPFLTDLATVDDVRGVLDGSI